MNIPLGAPVVLATALTLLLGCTLPGVPSEAEGLSKEAAGRHSRGSLKSPEAMLQGLIKSCDTEETFFIDYEDSRYTFICYSDNKDLNEGTE